MNKGEYRLAIRGETDVTRALLQGKKCAAARGFDATQQTLIATAISELARNILKYAGTGEVILRPLDEVDRLGLEIIARDKGPGIEDIELAMKDHVSTGGTLGLGLPGVKRMMDEMTVESERQRGTVVTIRKWL
jgi:serine/threonine-protein kinase RsbT